MYSWGDEDVDWKGISDAAVFLGTYCAKWARLGGQTKEKYGTVRYYVTGFGDVSLHSLVYPQYMYNQFPSWLWSLDINYLQPALTFLFGKVFFHWQKFIYNRAYQLALKKWPHLMVEILTDADHIEYIKGVTTVVEGNRVHALIHNSEIISTWERLGK